MSDIERLRQEADNLKNQIRVRAVVLPRQSYPFEMQLVVQKMT